MRQLCTAPVAVAVPVVK
ncbi:hypothetical protein GFB56_24900 [Ensifer sp. T173]|uniref:Uncharacterized protein n=1 Tax=Ensifer canadensis TaxID=555315 RepID=A0AAW4FRS4_9HYPH|nr:hypothetical protein [Ensifer sp. ENS11]MBM3093996.1 hypothetical protein [Ensifer canadensis]NOV17112.1 hypothetical protein [Ensifer canadensis]UBI79213.1 hypothetical protein J3R84_22800 [Ensifer canadensis]